MKLNKSRLNIQIDSILLVLLMAMAGIGFLIKYVLLAGYQRNIVYGNDVDLYFLGYDRHQWGTVHLVISLIFIFFLGLHLILHLSQIKAMVKKWIPGKTIRCSFYILLSVLCIFLGLISFVVRPELLPREYHSQQQNQRELNDLHESESENLYKSTGSETPVIDHEKKSLSANKEREHVHDHSDIQVFGYMTISELAEKYHILASDICRNMNIPEEKANERIGRLKREYAFEMEDLKKYVEKETGFNPSE